MPYTSSPFAAKARKLAIITLKKEGLSCAEMARRMGVNRSTILRWKRLDTPHYRQDIETRSSRPCYHPNTLTSEVTKRIIELRAKLRRSAPVIQRELAREGITISASVIGKKLKQLKLTRKRKQASYYQPLPRPKAESPGDLVQVDTIHFVTPKGRFYIYAVIDLYSRVAWAYYSPKIGQKVSLKVVREAEKKLGFRFKTVQTDNGPEFKDGFAIELSHRYIKVRHSRIRRPNDNAHVERFIRTLQEEALGGKIPPTRGLQQRLATYLDYYNNHRLHFGLQLQTPTEFVAKVLS